MRASARRGIRLVPVKALNLSRPSSSSPRTSVEVTPSRCGCARSLAAKRSPSGGKRRVTDREKAYSFERARLAVPLDQQTESGFSPRENGSAWHGDRTMTGCMGSSSCGAISSACRRSRSQQVQRQTGDLGATKLTGLSRISPRPFRRDDWSAAGRKLPGSPRRDRWMLPETLWRNHRVSGRWWDSEAWLCLHGTTKGTLDILADKW